MKTIITTATLLLTLSATAQHSVTVEISNFRNNRGVCRSCIYATEESMEAEKPLRCTLTPVANRSAVTRFENLPAGNYAILVFHDANKNNRFDTNFLGIPSEGYGASRNALPFAAAPTFKGNQFHLQGTQVLRIRLRNL